MFKRRPLPKGIRHEVFKRDNFKCAECGKGKDVTTLEVDHILPVSKGGTDEMHNLRTLCYTCNREKNDLVHENHNPIGFDKFFTKEKKIEDDTLTIKKHWKNVNEPKKCPICKGKNQTSMTGMSSRIALWYHSSFMEKNVIICDICYKGIQSLFEKEESLLKNKILLNSIDGSNEDRPPMIKGIPRSDGGGLQFYCPFCKRFHLHGGDGSKSAHCDSESPLRNTGYVLQKDISLPDNIDRKQLLEKERDVKNNWRNQFTWE